MISALVTSLPISGSATSVWYTGNISLALQVIHGSLFFTGVLKNPCKSWNLELEFSPTKLARVAEEQKEQ
jgi:hypothetical protein